MDSSVHCDASRLGPDFLAWYVSLFWTSTSRQGSPCRMLSFIKWERVSVPHPCVR